MFYIKLADLIIQINNKHDYVKDLCASYIVNNNNDFFHFSVSVSETDIENERQYGLSNDHDGYLESLCIYRNIAKQLPHYDGFVMHCAAVQCNNKAFCFAGPSGTGKTTHIKLWKKNFGDSIGIINGDKPIIRLVNGIFIVYGSPWSGKENYNKNTSAALGGLCYLKQDKINFIKQLDKHKALNLSLKQIYLEHNSITNEKTIDLIGLLIKNTPIWELSCNISDEAAIMSFNTMNGSECE